MIYNINNDSLQRMSAHYLYSPSGPHAVTELTNKTALFCANTPDTYNIVM